MKKKYRCIKSLSLDYYDDDGSFDEEAEPITVEVGETFVERSRYPGLIVAAPPAIHLESDNDDGRWIEIYPETLHEHFVEEADHEQ